VPLFDVNLSKVGCFAQQIGPSAAIRGGGEAGSLGENRSPWKDSVIGHWKRWTVATDLSAEQSLEADREAGKTLMCNPDALAQRGTASVPPPRNGKGAAATVNVRVLGSSR
jgi:hypothetical protein